MKKLFIAALVFALGGTNILHAQNLPDQKETLNTLIKVNKHYMKNNPTAHYPVLSKERCGPAISGHALCTTRTAGSLLHLSGY